VSPASRFSSVSSRHLTTLFRPDSSCGGFPPIFEGQLSATAVSSSRRHWFVRRSFTSRWRPVSPCGAPGPFDSPSSPFLSFFPAIPSVPSGAKQRTAPGPFSRTDYPGLVAPFLYTLDPIRIPCSLSVSAFALTEDPPDFPFGRVSVHHSILFLTGRSSYLSPPLPPLLSFWTLRPTPPPVMLPRTGLARTPRKLTPFTPTSPGTGGARRSPRHKPPFSQRTRICLSPPAWQFWFRKCFGPNTCRISTPPFVSLRL